jgi:hypothetical protein
MRVSCRAFRRMCGWRYCLETSYRCRISLLIGRTSVRDSKVSLPSRGRGPARWDRRSIAGRHFCRRQYSSSANR